MKNFKTLRAMFAASLWFAVIASCPAQAPTWTTHDYSADGFSISLPSDPRIDLQKDASNSQMRSYTVALDQSVMIIGVMRFASLSPKITPDAILQNGKNSALAQSKTRLIREKKITLGDAPGLDFEAENDTLHIRAQVYLTGGTAYQLIEGYPLGKPFEHAADFFDSFRLTGNGATPDQQAPNYGPLSFNTEGADFYVAQDGKFAPASLSDGAIVVHLHSTSFQIGYNGEKLNLCLGQSPFPEMKADPTGYKASCLSGPLTGVRGPNSDALLVYGGHKWSDGNTDLSDATSMKTTPLKGFRSAYQINQLLFVEDHDMTLARFKGTIYGYIFVAKHHERTNQDVMPIQLIFE